MKTIKEVALDLEVTPATVYNHLKKLDKEMKGNIFKKKGITYLDDEGMRQLKISMGLLEVPSIQEYHSLDQVVENINKSVTEQLTINITEHIDEQIKNTITNELEDILKHVGEITEQNKVLIEMLEKQQKNTFSNKLKNIFKSEE